MSKLSVYDPAMCCSTGVCGPAVDATLPRFASDLEWLKRQGVEVERYNLAQQPQAFATNAVVVEALHEHGNDCLPLVLVDGVVAMRGAYPSRAELAQRLGLEVVVESEAAEADSGGCCSSPGLVTLSGPVRRSE